MCDEWQVCGVKLNELRELCERTPPHREPCGRTPPLRESCGRTPPLRELCGRTLPPRQERERTTPPRELCERTPPPWELCEQTPPLRKERERTPPPREERERAPQLTPPWRPSHSDAEPSWGSPPATPVPVWHSGFKRLGQAPPEEDQEAGLLCRRPTSDFLKVPGVLLNAPISLTDVNVPPRWTHDCWLDSVTVQWEKSPLNRDLGPSAGNQFFYITKRSTGKKTKQYSKTGHHRRQRLVLVSWAQKPERTRSQEHSKTYTCTHVHRQVRVI